MPSRFKLPPKSSKSKIKKQEEPETADEFLAASVEFEEAGEKWRAGDAAKSARFFLRAIETYDRGLSRWPESFDLAYNKARLQYSITQQPRLAAQIPFQPPLSSILRTALESHRYALQLNPSNPDVIFNTAQVLSSLAEAIADGKGGRDYSTDWREKERQDAVGFYEEALGLFRECLLVQERMFDEGERRRREMEGGFDQDMPSTNHDPADTLPPADSPQAQWASIEEPITRSTLLDTAIAILETLTSLCDLYPDNSSAPYSTLLTLKRELCEHKIPAYFSSEARTPTEEELPQKNGEVQLAIANFDAAWAEAEFRSEGSDGYGNVKIYEDRLRAVFETLTSSLARYELDPTLTDLASLCDHAEALLSFNASVSDLSPAGAAHTKDILDKRFKALTKAVRLLTIASKVDSPVDTKARVNMRRGDVEMGRLKIMGLQGSKDSSGRVDVLLMKNAQTYYRGALRLAYGTEPESDLAREARLKLLIASDKITDQEWGGPLLKEVFSHQVLMKRVLVDMLEEGLIGDDVVSRMMGLASIYQ